LFTHSVENTHTHKADLVQKLRPLQKRLPLCLHTHQPIPPYTHPLLPPYFFFLPSRLALRSLIVEGVTSTISSGCM